MIGKDNIGIMTHSTIVTVDIEVLVISAIDLIESVMNSATIFDSVHIWSIALLRWREVALYSDHNEH